MEIDINPEPPKFHVVTITVREVYEAFEKNGMEHIRGSWYGNPMYTEAGDFVETAGCIMAQGAKNLKTFGNDTNYTREISDLFSAAYEQANSNESYNLSVQRYEYNLQNQLNNFNIPYDSPWYLPFEGPHLGNIIIAWNDRVDDETGEYALQTWEDVLRMAKEVMTSFFNEAVELLQYS